jgi:hypothetical protein
MGFTKIPAATNRVTDFTSSGTWVCPSGVYSAEFLIVGAGGGGGAVTLSSALNYGVGGGGGGGAVKKVNLSVTPGTSYTVTVGAKGVGATGAAGTNGGFSEVVLSGVTLVRSFGGQGASSVVSGSILYPSLTTGTIAGALGQAGGDSTATTWLGSGGGGAAFFSSQSTTFVNNRFYGSEGAGTHASTSTTAQVFVPFGQPGIDGYGAGGGGGSTNPSVNYNSPSAAYNAGQGASRTTTGATAGGNAGANSGSGGGGAAAHTSTTAVAGGNGGDGLVRITYFA